MASITIKPAKELTITWPLLLDDFELSNEPAENIDQPLIAAALRQSIIQLSERFNEALIVSNFALCAGIEGRIICKAPDWMYVQPVAPWPHNYPRRSYTPHTEGPVPHVVMEFLSETYGEEYSVEFTQRIGKWYFYEQVIQVPTYVIFQPNTGRLEVYQLQAGRYQLAEANETGYYWIAGVELFLGVWQGTHESRAGNWLRWWNADQELVLWPEEVVEIERQRTETEQQRAETERQEKELAQQRSAALEARLRELGIDV